jgi:hypothetical protein
MSQPTHTQREEMMRAVRLIAAEYARPERYAIPPQAPPPAKVPETPQEIAAEAARVHLWHHAVHPSGARG